MTTFAAMPIDVNKPAWPWEVTVLLQFIRIVIDMKHSTKLTSGTRRDYGEAGQIL